MKGYIVRFKCTVTITSSRTHIFRLSGEMKYISDDTQQLFGHFTYRFVILLFEKNIQLQTKLHIVHIGMLQVTRSNIGFYLIYNYTYIYLRIITNQIYSYLLLLFTKYSFIANWYTFIKQHFF